MPRNTAFEPKLVSVLRNGYSRTQFFRDLNAGIITGIVAFPLAIAFAIASGATPEQGLLTAIIAGVIIASLSGSRVQIGGPTGAFIVIVAGIIHTHGMNGLLLATIMAGGMLLLMGALQFGSIISFIPYPVTIGFTSGIACIIALGQLPDLLGFSAKNIPEGFSEKLTFYGSALTEANWAPLVLGVGTFIFLRIWPRISRRVPGSVVAILIGSCLVAWTDMPAETISTRFGALKASFPMPSIPSFTWADITTLLPAAASIAMLGAIESLLSAVVADGMIGGRHRPNMELIAQGAANLITPLFGGIPSTGAIARTATNIQNGGRTPIAGIIHGITLAAIVLVFAPLAGKIPLAVLAGILLGVALRMSEYRVFLKMFRAPRSDVMTMLVTWLLTIFIDLTVAIPVGMVMASFLFMRRMAQVCNAEVLVKTGADDSDDQDPMALGRFPVPDGVAVFEIDGPFFFGAARKAEDAMLNVKPKVLILRLRNVPAIDATGLFALEDMVENATNQGTIIILSGVRHQPLEALRKSGLLDRLGEDHTTDNIADALERARMFLTNTPRVE